MTTELSRNVKNILKLLKSKISFLANYSLSIQSDSMKFKYKDIKLYAATSARKDKSKIFHQSLTMIWEKLSIEKCFD